MAAPLFRSLVAFACLLPVATAYGQDQSDYVPVTPTLSERMSQLRTNLFGGGSERGAQPHSHARAQEPRGGRQSTMHDSRSAPTRPSQAATPNNAHNQALRSYRGTAAMTGRPITAQNSNSQGAASPQVIDMNNLPSLARRPMFGPAPATATSRNASRSNYAPAASQGMAGAYPPAQPADDDVGPIGATGAEEPSSGEMQSVLQSRNDLFPAHAGSSRRTQQIFNPAAGAPAAADTAADAGESGENSLPPLARSPRPAVAGPVVAPVTPPAGSTAQMSSRRGFSPVAPAERMASSAPLRDSLSVAADDDELLFKRQSPLISIETAGPRTMIIGKEGTYTVTVQNAGEVAANEVVVSIRVPEWADVVATKETAGVAHVPAAAANENATALEPAGADLKAVRWNLPRLEAKSKEQLSLQIVPRQSRPFDLAVQWSFTPITQSTVVQVQEPKLVMELAGPADVLFGETKIYKMTLSNPGTGNAENVVIHLSPLTGQGGAVTKHPIGVIKAGENKVIEVELTARQAGQVVIHALATADGGLQSEVKEEVTVRRAELAVKIDGAKTRYAGTVASYQIDVANAGTAPAEDVQVVAALPAGAKFVGASSGGQVTAEGKVHWTIPTVRDGGHVALELKCLVNNPGVNRLAVESAAAGEISAAAEDVCQVEALADLRLDVIEPKGPIAVGADVTYEIRVVNRGSKSASDVKVVGYFSGKIDPVAASGGEHRLVPGIVIFRPIGALPPGGEATFKITAVAKAAGHHMFKAEVVCEAAGAKLGSEHTTLFYGDEIQDPADGEAPAAEVSPMPLAPRNVFGGDDRSSFSASEASGSVDAQPRRWEPSVQGNTQPGTMQPGTALRGTTSPAAEMASDEEASEPSMPVLSNRPATSKPSHWPATNPFMAPNETNASQPRSEKPLNSSAAESGAAPALQKAPAFKTGSAYLPIGRSTAAPAAVPVSPFALRPTTKK